MRIFLGWVLGASRPKVDGFQHPLPLGGCSGRTQPVLVDGWRGVGDTKVGSHLVSIVQGSVHALDLPIASVDDGSALSSVSWGTDAGRDE